MRKYILLAILIGLLSLLALPVNAGDGQDDDSAAKAAKQRHTDELLGVSDVVGTAVGRAADGSPAVLVFARSAGHGRVPQRLDGVPVVVHLTGEISALDIGPNDKGGVASAASTTTDPRKRFTRPVPIGVSTGNALECAAGTIGARVTNGTSVYALSNNHVYARGNAASLGEQVLQPGRFDTGCVYDANNHLGNLSAFAPILFSTTASNTIDAAIALSSTANLGRATPSNGYGTPRNSPTAAVVGQAVQKYGRTTSLTKGTVVATNATILVNYGAAGTARFVNQIVVLGGKPFSKAGDSGSLIVTNPGRNPVGLLFAGSSNGYTFANRIDLVLSNLGVTIDGAP